MHLRLAHHLKVVNVTVDAAIIVLLNFREFILGDPSVVRFTVADNSDSAFVPTKYEKKASQMNCLQ